MHTGQFNDLKILRFTSVGAYLADEQDQEVLLPNKYLTNEMQVDDTVHVFVYRDSEDRIVATTQTPHILMNGFAYLKITSVNYFGAFADWGLEKELLIPFKEQGKKVEQDKWYLCCLLHDEKTDRLYGTTKISKYLKPCKEEIAPEQEVDLLICDQTELGCKVIVDNQYDGLIYHSDLHKALKRGQHAKGYVTKVREDGKLDVRLEKPGYGKIEGSAKELLDLIKENGHLMLTDKSAPDDIRDIAGMSKKTFKQAVGNLYKQRLIILKKDRIELSN